jgi:hypothetical protein
MDENAKVTTEINMKSNDCQQLIIKVIIKKGTCKATLVEDAVTTARLLILHSKRGTGGRSIEGNNA